MLFPPFFEKLVLALHICKGEKNLALRAEHRITFMEASTVWLDIRVDHFGWGKKALMAQIV